MSPHGRNRYSERVYRAVRAAGLGRDEVERFVTAYRRDGLPGIAALNERVAELLEIELRLPGQVWLDPHGRSFRDHRRRENADAD